MKIEIGKTYTGSIDYKRGLGPNRTVIDYDPGLIVTIRNEVGDNPPECYVMLATMGEADFIAWATEGENNANC